MATPGCACLVGLAYWGSSKARSPPHQTADTNNHSQQGDTMRIVNLTPHPVTLVTAGGDEVVVQPEATPVRIPATTTPAGEVGGIPLVREQLGTRTASSPPLSLVWCMWSLAPWRSVPVTGRTCWS